MSNNDDKKVTKSAHLSQSQQKAADLELVANAMTMQKALETAYNDWNREKVQQVSQSTVKVDADEPVVDAKSTQVEETVVSEKSPVVTKKIGTELTVADDKATTEIAYYFGNPTVDLVKGFIHIYKDW
jgi:hypothetical protein